ncbi:MAG TPA: IMP cyclohydrolase [Chloroflexi bacterium]|jgi:IMP cyclohydrolase|nr:IMP cyclohydrolase [Chloroflexota bacterium]
MYVGRFVVLGRTGSGAWYLGYRVSSRSFPNRTIRTGSDRAVVVPTADATPDTSETPNPYITYNCLRVDRGRIVVANGSHVDPIIERVTDGYELLGAITLPLLALGYERDAYNTPRIVAALDSGADEGYMGIVADDRVCVRRLKVTPGQAYLLATYELNEPTPIALEGNTPGELCAAIYEAEYEHPVAALAAFPSGPSVEMVVRSAR